MQSPSSSSTPSRTSSKMLSPAKTSSIKTKSTTVLNLGNPSTTSKDLETSLEIEKISKKISEHADALYRTWKSHGLAPTEILELYTVEAGVAAGAITDDKSTEDLQKLVNTFVNKDKEQRGVKTVKTKTASAKQEPTPKVIEHKIQTTNKLATPVNATSLLNNTNKLATPSTTNSKLITSNHVNAGSKLATSTTSNATLTAPLQHNTINKLATPSTTNISLTPTNLQGNTIIIEPSSPQTTPSSTIKKSTPSTKSTNFLLKSSTAGIDTPDSSTTKVTKLKTAKQGIGGGGSGSLNDSTKNTVKTQPSKSLDIDIDFNINLDLNLDVHKLTQQQTQNLQKIKELLQEPAKTPSPNATKIPTVTAEKMAGKSKEIKIKKSLIDSNKKSINSEENKQNEEIGGERKLIIETPQVNKKIGNKLKMTEETHDLNLNSPAIEAIIKKSKTQDNRDNNGLTATTNTPTTTSQLTKKRSPTGGSITANNSPTNIGGGVVVTPNGNVVTIEKDSSEVALLNEENHLAHTKENSNSIKLQKSTTKTTKSAKLKEKTEKLEKLEKLEKSLKESKETPLNKILDSKESAGNSAQIKSPLDQLTIEPVAQIVTQNMEIQRSDSTTIMPTPTKLKSTRPLSNGQEKSLKSPFLTRGSVAERVLMFEKCPDVRNSFLNIKRPDKADAPPKSLLKVKLHATPPPPPEQNSIQKEYRSNKSVYIPRFYFPHGKPQPTIALERTLRGILSAFDTFPNNQVTKDELPRILKICNLPFYWRMPVMVFCQQGSSGLVERQRFVDFWKQMNIYCHDDASRFVYILSRGQRFRTYILPEDLAPLVQDVVDTHPGLAFLKEATEFHSRYVHTVIARIFYSVNRSWSGKISISELKKSDLLEILSLLEEEDDINQIMAFFSYEHFYVIYCKFWELDKDHDLLINQDDLARHSDHALSTRIVERIFSGCVTKNDNKKNADDEPKMSYTDFVWFLLSEEDKRTPTAIEYWFRCMDVDGDGVLSMYELEYFYEEQQQRMESIGIESLPFEDCLCQMLDMIKPKRRDAITLGDLKNCKMTHVFFDTFFNLEKYLDHEQRDPFASQRDEYATDWDRFAAQEYELLITEEND